MCSFSVRYCISSFFLALVLGALRCGAVGLSDKLLSLPQGQTRHRCLLVLLSVLDSASTVRLEQVCQSLVSRPFTVRGLCPVGRKSLRKYGLFNCVLQLRPRGHRHHLFGPVAPAHGFISLLHYLFVHLLPPSAPDGDGLLLREDPAGAASSVAAGGRVENVFFALCRRAQFRMLHLL